MKIFSCPHCGSNKVGYRQKQEIFQSLYFSGGEYHLDKEEVVDAEEEIYQCQNCDTTLIDNNKSVTSMAGLFAWIEKHGIEE